MDLINELPLLLRNGAIVSVICTALFLIIKLPANWSGTVKGLIMKLSVVVVSFIWIWVTTEVKLTDIHKPDVANWILTISFAVVFYEFAGKFLVRKFFKGYRMKKEKEYLKQ